MKDNPIVTMQHIAATKTLLEQDETIIGVLEYLNAIRPRKGRYTVRDLAAFDGASWDKLVAAAQPEIAVVKARNKLYTARPPLF